MPSANVHQQRFMCQAMAVKEGKLKPEELNKKFKATIMKAANEMSMEDLQDYCKDVKGGSEKS